MKTIENAQTVGHTNAKLLDLAQSCPWVGLTRGLGWVGSGMGRKFVFFSGLGWVMGLK